MVRVRRTEKESYGIESNRWVQIHPALSGGLVKATRSLGIRQSSSAVLALRPIGPEDEGHARAAPLLLQHGHPDAGTTWGKGRFCRPQPDPWAHKSNLCQTQAGIKCLQAQTQPHQRGGSGRSQDERDPW